jgi:hypothetical protein
MMGLSLLAVPVFLDTNTEAGHLLRQWVRLYHYGHQMMPAMAVTTLALYGYTARSRQASHKPWRIWGAAGLVTVAMVPFTWIAMTATNNSLFQLDRPRGVIELRRVRELVVTWGRLHVVRSLFPLVGAIIGWSGMMDS